MNNQFEEVNFDPIAYLNAKFPDEESLIGLDQQIEMLNSQLTKVNKELIEQIHQHAMMNIQISEEIKKAKELSKEIISEIGIIKEKAKKSEEIVFDMCKDLKSLDIAKKNLTFSIDALKKFIMMVEALEKLRDACQKRQYAAVANLLDAFNELMKHFKKYQEIPQIQALNKDKNQIVNELFEQLMQDFQAYENGTSTLKKENMKAATTVIQILGDKFWRKFLTNFQKIILKQYEQEYGSPQNAVLQTTERRFGFIRRRIQQLNQKFGEIFPFEWGMDCLILYQFCSITRLHITFALEKSSGSSTNVAILMKSLEFCLKFQTKMTQSMTKKYGDFVKKQNKKKTDLHSLPKFTGSISNSFQNHLQPYIKSQEETLCETLGKSLDEDKPNEIKVFSSSIVMFHGIKNSIRRASNYSKGNLLVDIARIVKKIFKIYCDKCFGKIRINDHFDQNICWVINTADYCKNILSGLKENFEAAIDPLFAQSIEFDFSDEEQLFSNLISKSIQALIESIDKKVEASFSQISKIQWQKVEDFSDQAIYIKEVKEALRVNFSRIKDQMEGLYLTLYIDKIVLLIHNKFIQNIYKCKKLHQNAYQQLRMDLAELKVYLLKLVATDTKTYTNPKTMQKHQTFVNKTFSKGEGIIKLMGLNNEHFTQQFDQLTEGAGIQELQKILQVRGAKKSDFPALVKSIQSKHGV